MDSSPTAETSAEITRQNSTESVVLQDAVFHVQGPNLSLVGTKKDPTSQKY